MRRHDEVIFSASGLAGAGGLDCRVDPHPLGNIRSQSVRLRRQDAREGRSPLVGLAGAAAAVSGRRSRSSATGAGGGVAALLSAGFIRSVTMPHQGFERAFGPDWTPVIPSDLAWQFLPRRWNGCLDLPVRAPSWANLAFWDVPGRPPGGDNRRLLCDLWEPPPGVSRSRAGRTPDSERVSFGFFVMSLIWGFRQELMPQGGQMIQIEFRPEAIDALEYERYHHPDPKVQRKMEASISRVRGWRTKTFAVWCAFVRPP